MNPIMAANVASARTTIPTVNMRMSFQYVAYSSGYGELP
jgi:hypothetical protein